MRDTATRARSEAEHTTQEQSEQLYWSEVDKITEDMPGRIKSAYICGYCDVTIMPAASPRLYIQSVE